MAFLRRLFPISDSFISQLNQKYAYKSHTHSQYAYTSHTHSQYASKSHTHYLSDIVDYTPGGGGSGGDVSLDWNSITGKPSVYPPDTHTHQSTEILTNLEGYSNLRENLVDLYAKVSLIDSGGTIVTWDSITGKPNFDQLYAKVSHTHDYLPLSGGTITGSLQVNQELTVYNGSTNAFINLRSGNNTLQLVNQSQTCRVWNPSTNGYAPFISGAIDIQSSSYSSSYLQLTVHNKASMRMYLGDSTTDQYPHCFFKTANSPNVNGVLEVWDVVFHGPGGKLGFPNYDAPVDIESSIDNSGYTASRDGWITVRVNNNGKLTITGISGGQSVILAPVGSTGTIMFPIKSGERVVASGGAGNALFFPMR